jgi:hypothetical protein
VIHHRQNPIEIDKTCYEKKRKPIEFFGNNAPETLNRKYD